MVPGLVLGASLAAEHSRSRCEGSAVAQGLSCLSWHVRDLPGPGDRTSVSCTGRRILNHRTTRLWGAFSELTRVKSPGQAPRMGLHSPSLSSAVPVQPLTGGCIPRHRAVAQGWGSSKAICSHLSVPSKSAQLHRNWKHQRGSKGASGAGGDRASVHGRPSHPCI